VIRESDLPILPLVSQGHITWEREGQILHMLLKERRKGDCGNAINSEYFDNSGGSYTGRQVKAKALEEVIGKTVFGKPNVRFDGGSWR